MEVVINKCYGGFSISGKALKRYLELKGKKLFAYDSDYISKTYTRVDDLKEGFGTIYFTKYFGESFKSPEFICGGPQTEEYKAIWDHFITTRDMPRDDPDLIKVVKELGKEANGFCAELKIVEIPDGISWEIDEYDGLESVEEVHRSWG